MRALLPNTKILQGRAAASMLNRPDPDCVIDAGPALAYFDFGRPFAPTFAILVGYLLVCHVLTYVALRVVARKEKR
jgi:hypothetical protein